MHMDMSQEPFMWKLTGKMLQAKTTTSVLGEPAQSNPHGHVAIAILCGNLQVKCQRPRPGQAFWASRRSRNASNLDMSEEHSVQKFTGKKVGTQIEQPDQALAFTPTVRTPLCGRAVWVKSTRFKAVLKAA